MRNKDIKLSNTFNVFRISEDYKLVSKHCTSTCNYVANCVPSLSVSVGNSRQKRSAIIACRAGGSPRESRGCAWTQQTPAPAPRGKGSTPADQQL